MSKGKNHTDRVFRDSLREYQAAPPEGVWSGIADTLESGRKKSRNSLMAGIAAAAAVIIAAGSIWVLTRRNPEIQMVRTETTEATTTSQESQTLEAEPAIPDPDDLKDTGPGPEQEIRTDEVPVREQENLAEDGPAVNSEYLTDVSYGQEQAVQPESRELQPGGTNAGQLGLDRGQTPEALFPGSGQSEFVVEGGPGFDPSAESEEIGLSGQILGKQITGFPVREPGQELMATAYKPRPVKVGEDEGIDVFEEFGENGTHDFNRWAIGGQVSPMYSYRNLKATDAAVTPAPATTSATAGSYNDNESGIISYAAGVNLNYFPARRLSLQSGLYYSRMGMTVGANYIASADDQVRAQEFPPAQLALSNSSGQIELGGQQDNKFVSSDVTSSADAWGESEFKENRIQPEVQEGEILQHFEYIEVPLIVRYRVVDRRLGLNFLGGFSTNFLVGSSVYLQDGGDREYIGTTEELKPVNYSSVLGLGLQYSISSNFFINMEPTFRYYLNSVNTGSGIGSHPYSLGFFTGISYLF